MASQIQSTILRWQHLPNTNHFHHIEGDGGWQHQFVMVGFMVFSFGSLVFSEKESVREVSVTIHFTSLDFVAQHEIHAVTIINCLHFIELTVRRRHRHRHRHCRFVDVVVCNIKPKNSYFYHTHIFLMLTPCSSYIHTSNVHACVKCLSVTLGY